MKIRLNPEEVAIIVGRHYMALGHEISAVSFNNISERLTELEITTLGRINQPSLLVTGKNVQKVKDFLNS